MGLHVSLESDENLIRARVLIEALFSINSLYELFAAAGFDPDAPLETLEIRLTAIHSPNPLRIARISSGSLVKIDFTGSEGAFDGVRRILETLRDWDEKTEQEREKTRAMRLANLKEALAIRAEIAKLPKEEQELVYHLAGESAERLARLPVKILPS